MVMNSTRDAPYSYSHLHEICGQAMIESSKWKKLKNHQNTSNTDDFKGNKIEQHSSAVMLYKFYARLKILLNFEMSVKKEKRRERTIEKERNVARALADTHTHTYTHTKSFMSIQLTYGNGLWKFVRCQPSVSSIGRTKTQRIIIVMRLCVCTDFLLFFMCCRCCWLPFTLKTPCVALFISHNVKAIPTEQFISRVDTNTSKQAKQSKAMNTMRKWQKTARYYPIIDFKRLKTNEHF